MIYTLNNRIQNKIAPFLKEKSISFSEGQILLFLSEQSTPSQEYLALRMGMKKSFVSQVITSLTKKGYVLEKQDQRDRRNKELSLSQEGIRVADDFNVLISKYNEKILESLTDYNKINIDLLLKEMISNVRK